MAKKNVLGKGLDALFTSNNIKDDNGISLIDINRIRPNNDQPRRHFDEEKISNLSMSIKENGIIQPIILKSAGADYQIIAGERRWRAAKLAGISEVPAVIMDLSDQKILEISLIENVQREDLNSIEEAIAFKKLIDEFKITQQGLSEIVGRSRTAIANIIRLLSLDERVQEYIIEGVLTEGHGRAILIVKDKDRQFELATDIIDNELSVREAEKLAKLIENPKEEKIIEELVENPYIKEIQNRISDRFSTKVSIKRKDNEKGKIEIEYFSADEFERIIEMLENN